MEEDEIFLRLHLQEEVDEPESKKKEKAQSN